MYLVAAERQGADLGKLDGTLQTDIFKEYIAQKEWLFAPEPHLRLIGDLIEYCAHEIPRYKPLSVSGYHIREAGSTAAQELAYTLADGFGYVELGLSRGLDVNRFAPGLSFFFDSHLDFFEEIAKFRAARRIWAQVMREEFGAKDPRSQMLRFHTQTAGVQLTAQQPEVNLVRVTVQGLAAVLGGTQSLHTNSYDEAIGLPTEKAARLAVRTQQVLAYESDVTRTVDPFAGSYVVESLTDDMEAATLDLMAQVEDLGGAVHAIERGFQKGEIERSAYAIACEIDSGERTVVGVNRFTTDGGEPYEPLQVDPTIEEAQARRLATLRADRSGAEVSRTLDALRTAASGTANVLDPMREALAARATVGEVCDALRDVWGVYEPPAAV
jgi:methylmalonyl-CoA mutase N-terminal domain/subunit